MPSLAARATLLGSSLAVSLLVGELAVRMLLPEVGERPRSDDSLGWSISDEPGLDVNGRGAAGLNALRILFVGDSYLTGAGPGSRKERTPTLLDQRFRPRVWVESIRAGGWGTDQEFLAVLQRGLSWQPDLIVLTFVPNDIANNLAYAAKRVGRKPYFVLEEDGDLQLYSIENRPVPLQPAEPVARSGFDSHLWSLIRYRLAPNRANPEPGPPAPPDAVDPRYIDFQQRHEPRNDITSLGTELDWTPFGVVNSISAYIGGSFPLPTYQWRLYERIVGELQRSAEEVGARLILLLLPVTYDAGDLRFVVGADFEHEFQTPDGPFTFRSAEPRDRLIGICERLGIELLDPTDDFRRILAERDLIDDVWPGRNRHFSAVGHEVLTELLAPWVEARWAESQPLDR